MTWKLGLAALIAILPAKCFKLVIKINVYYLYQKSQYGCGGRPESVEEQLRREIFASN